MGPASTVRFLDLIISKFRVGQAAALNSDFPQITMYTIPQSDHMSGSPNQQILGSLRRAFEVFSSADVSFVVVPCNTAHQFIPLHDQESEIQVLSISSSVSESIMKLDGGRRILYLATRQTQSSGIYDRVFDENHCKPILLGDADQDMLDDIIRQANAGGRLEHLGDDLLGIIERYPSNQTVLFACTELSLLVPFMKDFSVVDSLESLAEATYLVSSGQRDLSAYSN
jgi:aspartate racemase